MRLVIDSLIALLLVGILVVVLVHHRDASRELRSFQGVHESLARMQEQVLYHSTLAQGQSSSTGFVMRIEPAWFGADLPRNTLVPATQPWLDIATVGDFSDHPPDPVIRCAQQAGFWYNPNRGLLRARVTAQFTEQHTLENYNRANGSDLRLLKESSRNSVPLAARLPVPPRDPDTPGTGGQAASGTPSVPTPTKQEQIPPRRRSLRDASANR